MALACRVSSRVRLLGLAVGRPRCGVLVVTPPCVAVGGSLVRV